MPRVRLIDVEGEQLGLKTRDEALEYAWGKNLDLVEVAPDADPPVCRVMDYWKYKYEQEQKAEAGAQAPEHDHHQGDQAPARRSIRTTTRRRRATCCGSSRTATRSRSRSCSAAARCTTPSAGESLLLRLADDVKDLAVIESEPLQDGRNMVMMLAPHKEAVAAKPANEAGDAEAADEPSGAGRAAQPDEPERRPAEASRHRDERPSLQPDPSMPKKKTHSGAKKRFKITGTGKLMRRHGMKSHILEKKSPKRKRRSAATRPFARPTRRGQAPARPSLSHRTHELAMTRVKRSVNAQKKRRKVLEEASGYWGLKSKTYKRAKEQVQRSLQYAYRDRRVRKREFRKLWIVRINAAARQHGIELQPAHRGPASRRDRARPQGARRPRRARARRLRGDRDAGEGRARCGRRGLNRRRRRRHPALR